MVAQSSSPGSRLASARGRSFEALLNVMHDIYTRQGQAMIWFNGTRGSFKGADAFVPEESLADYGAVLLARGGRFAALDAKVTAEQRYAHPVKKMHQCIYLRDVQQFGGIAFLLVMVEPMDQQTPPIAYALWPQEYWSNPYRGWSIKLGVDLDPVFGVQVPAWDRLSEYCPDWLSLILQKFP